MFKLPGAPSSRASIAELADFAELVGWARGSVSMREIVRSLGQADDNDYNFGCVDNDDENAERLDEMLNEMERRREACGEGYPFELDREGTVVRHVATNGVARQTIYRYFLLCTRLNMKESRVQQDIDGASLFEEIAAQALKHYLGERRARAFVFGSAIAQSFEEKISSLCRQLGEGAFRNLDSAPIQAKDGALDAVAWAPFSDTLPGQLIVFAQCKTGTTWRGSVSDLQPDRFILKWMSGSVLVDPVRAFCVAEAANRSRWRELVIDAGILFDRCRLIDCLPGLPTDLFERVERWVSAVRLPGLGSARPT